MAQYINGSDSLVGINGRQVGYSSEHTTAYNADTKDRAVKPADTNGIDNSLWSETAVSGLNIVVNLKALRTRLKRPLYNPANTGAGAETLTQARDRYFASDSYPDLVKAWSEGTPIDLELYMRPDKGVSSTTPRDPYLKGKFIITKISENAQAKEDANYDVELRNSGKPEIFATDKAFQAEPDLSSSSASTSGSNDDND